MADTFAYLPGITSTLRDGGLQVAQQDPEGDSILVIGTAEKGSLNEPIPVTSLDNAVSTFGSIAKGTLVRGIFEAMNASNGAKDIRGCRIGNATKATLSIAEASASGSLSARPIDDATLETAAGIAIDDAVVLDALYEGDEFNGGSIRLEVINNIMSVVFYNPVTDTESVMTYNPDQDQLADIHDAGELVDALNADSNFNAHYKATLKDLQAVFELDTRLGSNTAHASGVSIDSNGTLFLDLSTRLDPTKVGYDGTYTTYPYGVHDVTIYNNIPANIPTAANELIQLNNVYGIEQCTDASGNYTQELVESAGKTSVSLSHVPISKYSGVNQAYTGTTLIKLDGSATTSSTVKQVVTNGLVGTSLDGATLIFTFDADVEPDSATFKLYETSGGAKTRVATEDFSLSYSAGNEEATVTYTAGNAPAAGTIITCDYWSNEQTLTEATSAAAATATNSWKTYFVTGNTLRFGAAAPHDIVVTYQWKKTFSLIGDVDIYDADNGILRFTNPSNSPASGMLAATEESPYTIGLDYDYKPEWVDIGSAAKSLQGGGDGIVMSNLQKYDALETCFDNISNYTTDIIVLMDAYVDDTKQDYNTNTGALETMNAGFHTLFHDFLEELSTNTNETIGIMSICPAAANTLSAVNTWYQKATEISSSDPTRAANLMSNLDSKYISVCAMEPIFTNDEVSVPYIQTGEALYAGLISLLDPQSAPTNKIVSGILGTRYRLSSGQLDKLTQMRYVTLRNRPGRGIVVTDGVTAAATGSDYTRLSTLRTVFHAMDVVRAQAEPFIGEPNDAEQRNALDTAISKGLQMMVERGELRDFAFNVTATVAEMIAGVARVEMILVPRFEMRQIKVEVKLRPSL